MAMIRGAMPVRLPASTVQPSVQWGGLRMEIPACRNSLRMSEGQDSNTSRWVVAGLKLQERSPLAESMRMAR